MSTVSTRPEPTTGTPTSSWRGSTCTTTRPAAASTCPGPSWWTWSPAPWTVSAQDPSDRSSAQTTSCSDRAEPGTTGPRVTTRKVWLRACSRPRVGRGESSGNKTGFKSTSQLRRTSVMLIIALCSPRSNQACFPAVL